MSELDFLARQEVFSHFTQPQLARLAACLASVQHQRSVTILQEGDDSQDAYLVYRGEVRVESATPYGSFCLAQLGEGEMFGETSFVDRRSRSSSVVAGSNVELLTLSPLALAVSGRDDQAFEIAVYWAFWKSLSSKLRATNVRLAEFFAGGAAASVSATTSADAASSEFQVDLAAKRQLFAEQKLSGMEINFLASLSREEMFAGGQVIFREGEAGDKMYVVLEGRVIISKEIAGAGEEALAFLERGDYFGEMALIDRMPRSADAKADAGGAVVLAIPRDVLRGILDIEKVSSRRLLKTLCSIIAHRLRELDQKLVGWFILSGGRGA